MWVAGTIYFNQERTSWYKGQWLADLKHGHGEILYETGNVYVGQWEDNLKSGHGKMEWKVMKYFFLTASCIHSAFQTKNERYDGSWKNGKPDGTGWMTGPWCGV